MMHVILYLALLGATTFALPVYNENNHKSLVHQRTSPVDINPIIETQVFTQTERGPSVSNIVPEEQIREHQPGRIPQNYDKDAKGFLDQSEDEGWRAAENVVVLPFETMDTNDDGFVNNMELPYLLWSPNEINKALPGYDDDKYVFDDMMLTNAFITDDVSDKVNIPKETYMSIIVHTKPAGDGVKPLNVNPVNNFPDDDNTEEQEYVDYVDREVISEANPAEEEIHQSDMTGKESTFPQSEDAESMDPIDEEDIDETIPAEDEISQPEEGGLIDSMIGKESTFPQSEDPESMDPVDEEDIDEINPAEEGIYQPEEGGLIDSIDETIPTEEKIFQQKEGGLIDSLVGKERTFPESEEPESMDPVDEEAIDEINPVEEGNYQPQEESLIDSMIFFPQLKRITSINADAEEINSNKEGIYHPANYGQITPMLKKDIIFQQSKEMAPKDTDEKGSSDEVNFAKENVHREGIDHLVKFIVDKKNIFPQIKKPASDDEEVVQEIKSIKKGNYEQNVGEMTNFEGFPLQKPVVVEEKPETVPEIVSIHDDVVSSNPFTNVSEDMEHKNMV